MSSRNSSSFRHVVSDDHTGVEQRQLVLGLMRSVTEAPTREAAKNAPAVSIAALEKAPSTPSPPEQQGQEIFGVCALPEAHQGRMHTTNMLKRQNQELKRRT